MTSENSTVCMYVRTYACTNVHYFHELLTEWNILPKETLEDDTLVKFRSRLKNV